MPADEQMRGAGTMTEKICPMCGEPEYPHETITNWLVAQAAQWPSAGITVWRAIWPSNLP